jgi:hypothetical protein
VAVSAPGRGWVGVGTALLGLLLAGCASDRVRCDGRLTPINRPAVVVPPVATPRATPSSPVPATPQSAAPLPRPPVAATPADADTPRAEPRP